MEHNYKYVACLIILTLISLPIFSYAAVDVPVPFGGMIQTVAYRDGCGGPTIAVAVPFRGQQFFLIDSSTKHYLMGTAPHNNQEVVGMSSSKDNGCGKLIFYYGSSQ